MGSSRSKKNLIAENQRRETKKTRMSDVHRYKENDPSKKQQQAAQALVPKRSTFIGSNSKHLPTKPRKVLYPAPSVSYTSVKMSAPTFTSKSTIRRSSPRSIPQNISDEIQMKNDERINFTPSFSGFSANFGKAPITINFQNSLRSEYQSFNFPNVYPRFTCPTFGSIAVLPANNFTLSQNNTLNPSTGTGSTSTVTSTSSINGYKLNQITMSRRSTGSTDSSSGESTTGIHDGNRNVEGNNDEVVYLYTVDTTPDGRIVEEIDLSSESVTVDAASTSSSRKTLNLRKESKVSVSKAPVENPGPSYSSSNSTGSNKKCSEPKTSRKRQISETGKEKSNKRAKKDPFEPRCCVCEVHYDELTAVDGYMCISTTCGHLFCHSCSRREDKKKCDKCGKKIQLYRKLFL